MWTGHAKTAVARFCYYKPTLGSMERAVGIRRTSTVGEFLEPDGEMLKALVCPFSKLPLTYDLEARELLSPVGVAFPITANGIADMTPASARLVGAPPDGREQA
ncbi:unnamed protein product [Ectocarpus sp. 8 AP-2014]